MKFGYQVINFIILAAVLFIVGRKLIGKMFAGRRAKIEEDLLKAENGLRELEKASEAVDTLVGEYNRQLSEIESSSEKRLQIKRTTAAKESDEEKSRLDSQLEMQRRMLRQTMAGELNRGVTASIIEHTRREVVLPDNFDAVCAGAIGELVARSIGDSVTLRDKKLRIVLESAKPLDSNLSADLIALTAERYGLSPDGCDVSVRVNEDISGGMRLLVNDTVYDATLKGILGVIDHELKLNGPVDSEEELHTLITDKLQNMSFSVQVYQMGRIVSISDGICHVSGLSDAMYGEKVEFQGGTFGMVLDLEEQYVGCIIFGQYEKLEEGDFVRRTGYVMEVPVGESLLGRVVDALGKPIDGGGTIAPEAYRPVESPAPGIPDRKSVSVPLQTGIKAIDALVPIGRGQRELIIGDRQTGKTAIAVDTIINQKGKNVICIYVAIGQKESTVAAIQNTLSHYGAMEYTTIVCADAFHSAPMQYVAPYAGSAMGEYFMSQGKDVLIIFDDLSKHAVAYREISLLLHRPSGREAYPGDVFYLHSRLLERSARLNEQAGGGSMTALPIIETQAGDISAYIPTNVISITDGQIFLESELFHAGQRPAVNVGLSVSRVGGSAQIGAMRQISGRLRMDLAQYRELAAFAQFGSDLDAATKHSIEKGERMMALLNQAQYSPMPVELQVLSIYAVAEGYADDITAEQVSEFEKQLHDYFASAYPGILEEIASGAKMSSDLLARIRYGIKACKENSK